MTVSIHVSLHCILYEVTIGLLIYLVFISNNTVTLFSRVLPKLNDTCQSAMIKYHHRNLICNENYLYGIFVLHLTLKSICRQLEIEFNFKKNV